VDFSQNDDRPATAFNSNYLHESTKEDGCCSVRLPPGESSFEVSAEHGEFQVGKLTVAVEQLDDDHQVILKLVRGAVIEGRVALSNEGPPAPGVHVYAWEAGAPRPSPSEITALLDSREIAATKTDSRGNFRIEGLAPGVPHCITAGGLGLVVLAGRRCNVVAPVDNLEIVVGPIFVLDVRFTDPSGFSPAPDQRLYAFPSTTWSTPDSMLDIQFDPHALALAGLRDTTREENCARIFTFYTSAAAAAEDRLGPVDVRAVLPGYEPVISEVWAYRLQADGEYRVSTVSLEQIALGFGDLIVEVADSAGPTPGRTTPLAEVRLYPDGWSLPGDLRFLNFAIGTSQEKTLVQNVPSGNYRAKMMSTVRFDEAAIAIGVGDAEQLVLIAAEPWGSLTVESSLDETRVLGPLTVRLRHNGRVTFHSFSEPPYRIDYLREGRYFVRASIPGHASKELALSVVAGDVVDVPLKLEMN